MGELSQITSGEKRRVLDRESAMSFVMYDSPGFVTVQLSGFLGEDGWRMMLGQLAQRSKERGVDKAVIELDIDASLSSKIILTLIEELTQYGFPPGFRFAAVLLNERIKGAAHFTEAAGMRRGRSIKLFRDREEATRWLFSQE